MISAWGLKCNMTTWLLRMLLYHRSDSIQGFDYIANNYIVLFLNLRVCRIKIENLK